MSIKHWTAIGCQIPGQALGEGFQQVEETSVLRGTFGADLLPL